MLNLLRKLKSWFQTPVATKAEIRMRQRLECEMNANLLMARIHKCRSGGDILHCSELVDEFVGVWGHDPQVHGWVMTFELELQRQQALIEP